MLDYHGSVRHFQCYQHAKSFHTLRWIFILCFMKFDERDHFCFKVCPTDSDFVGLSRSTRCGCYSYQVSSISVRSYDVSWSLMKEIKKKIKIHPFLFPWQLRLSLSYQFRYFFLAYLVPLDVDVTVKTLLQKFVKFGVNLTFFAPWLPSQRPPFWILSTPKAVTHYGGYSYKVSWSLMKEIQIIFKSPFFVSMATAAKIAQPIPIFWLISFH